MTEQKEIVPAGKPAIAMDRVKSYLLSPEVKERFSDMMGTNGIYYLNQVLITVANSEDLQQCEPKSILVAAMRAASLKLNVDPATGQAWIIPYNGKATLQIGYRGIYELAMRTNLYRFINVIDIYEGETLEENRLTGMHAITGKATGRKVVAYMLYFQLLNGFEKTFVMTVDEIMDHARRYSPTFNGRRSPWNDERERPKMMKKTVLSNGLRKWGRFNTGDKEVLDQIENEQGWMERIPEESEVTIEAQPKKSEPQLMAELGFGDPVTESVTDVHDDNPEPDWDHDVLKALAEKFELAIPRLRSTLKYAEVAMPGNLQTLDYWLTNYKAQRDEGKTPQEAAKIVNSNMHD